MKKRRLLALIISFMVVYSFTISACATEMSAVYVGGKVSTTGYSLGFTYSSSSTLYWYPEVTTSGGTYCAAVIKCTFSKGLLTSYDKCQITGVPVSGICCYATVENKGGNIGTTSICQQSDGASTTVKVKHASSTVYYTVTFGKP